MKTNPEIIKDSTPIIESTITFEETSKTRQKTDLCLSTIRRYQLNQQHMHQAQVQPLYSYNNPGADLPVEHSNNQSNNQINQSEYLTSNLQPKPTYTRPERLNMTESVDLVTEKPKKPPSMLDKILDFTTALLARDVSIYLLVLPLITTVIYFVTTASMEALWKNVSGK